MALGGAEEEGFLDGGIIGPLKEELEELLAGLLLGLVETLFLEFDAAGVEVAAAEADDVLGEDAEVFALFFKFLGGLVVAMHEGLGVVEGEEAKEGIGEAIGGLGEIAGVGGKVAGPLDDLLVAEPIAIAAFFPFAEVLGADGSASEVGRKHGFNLGDFVEPLGDLNGGLALGEELVGLVAKGAGQTGDFAVAFGVGVGSKGIRERIHDWIWFNFQFLV